MSVKNNIKAIFVIAFGMIFFSSFAQSNLKFKVVLDPGHGGKDHGTVHNSYVEKKIALSVALKVGKILENLPNFEVLYTRKTDVFIELMERANIANKAKADFFVSIHCNGVSDENPSGTETYVMGLTKNASNLEVAKRENEVITLESDYKLKYKGFDPRAPESMIGIKLLQEEYIERSITLAGKIQDQFTTQLKRKNRGVKQGPILVLNQSAMPSVLIELGFLSNKSEGAYLDSEEGQNELARSIANAIIGYKSEFFRNNIVSERSPSKEITMKEEAKEIPKTIASKEVEKVTENNSNKEGIVFKVQILALKEKLDVNDSSYFNGLNNISYTYEKELYKYMYSSAQSYDMAKKELLTAKEKGFQLAFIVAFKDGKKISLLEALNKK